MKALAISLMLLLAVAFCKMPGARHSSVDVELKFVVANGNLVANRAASFRGIGNCEGRDKFTAHFTARRGNCYLRKLLI